MVFFILDNTKAQARRNLHFPHPAVDRNPYSRIFPLSLGWITAFLHKWSNSRTSYYGWRVYEFWGMFILMHWTLSVEPNINSCSLKFFSRSCASSPDNYKKSSLGRKSGSACRVDTRSKDARGAGVSLIGDAVAWCDLRSVAIVIGGVSWVSSISRSPIPASLHLVALQLKPSMPGLRPPERPLHFRFTPCDATGTQWIEIYQMEK